MFLFKNAMHNLKRNASRNVMLAVIIFAIIATTAVALIINNTANGIIEDYQFRFGSRVSIVPDTAQIMENMRGMMGGLFGGGMNRSALTDMNPQITPHQSIALAQLPYVHSYEMSASQPVFTTLETVDGEADGELAGMFGGMAGGRGGGGLGGMINIPGLADIDPSNITMPNLRLHGNHWEDFQNGQRDIAEGTFPAAYGEAMISLELAELNNLRVGDTLRIYNTSQENPRDLTIAGIYFDMTPDNPVGGFIRASMLNRRNEVLTTLETVIIHLPPPEDEQTHGITVTATYYLREPAQLPYFEESARALGLSPLLLVTTNTAEYETIVEPVVGLRDVSSTFMLIVLALGAVVLVVLAAISVRERKYEVGVLRAMGMKKKKLALGLMTEIFAMTLVCLILGLGLGTLAAQPISDRLLAAQLENIAPAETAAPEGIGMMGMGGFGGMGGGRLAQFTNPAATDAQPLSELNVSLGIRSVIQIVGISLALATLAGIAAVTRITKYEPMKILSERN
jgi:putative ABC transport system permease protein